MKHITGNFFAYTTNVTNERIYTVLQLFQKDEGLNFNPDGANMVDAEFYDAVARAVELKYIDGLSAVRSLVGKIWFTNCCVTDFGFKFIENFKSSQET